MFPPTSSVLASLTSLIIVSFLLMQTLTQAAPTDSAQALTCSRELDNANKTISQWGQTMESMVNESKLPAGIRESIHNEANAILDMIEDFGEHVKSKSPHQLAKDLVTIRRRSNRMALDIYLHTFDMRWPQTSLQVGVTVERVQQACFDRLAIQALESPPAPLESLLKARNPQ